MIGVNTTLVVYMSLPKNWVNVSLWMQPGYLSNPTGSCYNYNRNQNRPFCHQLTLMIKQWRGSMNFSMQRNMCSLKSGFRIDFELVFGWSSCPHYAQNWFPKTGSRGGFGRSDSAESNLPYSMDRGIEPELIFLCSHMCTNGQQEAMFSSCKTVQA